MISDRKRRGAIGGLRKIVNVSLFGVLSVFIFVVLCIIVILCVHVSSSSPKSVESTKREKYGGYHHSGRNSHQGFVSIENELKGYEDYVSYVNRETGSIFILSKFGGSEYECSGICYCQSEHFEEYSRRYISSTLSRGIKLVLFAFSSSMAYKLAEEAFQNQCVKKYEDSCDENYVMSDVEDCEIKETPNIHTSQKENESTEQTVHPEDLGKIERYTCRGHCLPFEEGDPTQMGFIDVQDFVNVGREKIGLCESIKLTETMELAIQKEDVNKPEFVGDKFLYYVKYQFVAGYLNKYCWEQSMLQIKDFSKMSQEIFQEAMDYVKTHEPDKSPFMEKFASGIPFCTGAVFERDQDSDKIKSFKVEHVECTLKKTIYPNSAK